MPTWRLCHHFPWQGRCFFLVWNSQGKFSVCKQNTTVLHNVLHITKVLHNSVASIKHCLWMKLYVPAQIIPILIKVFNVHVIRFKRMVSYKEKKNGLMTFRPCLHVKQCSPFSLAYFTVSFISMTVTKNLYIFDIPWRNIAVLSCQWPNFYL